MQKAIRQASDLLRKPLEPAGRFARDLAQRGKGPAEELTGRGRELAESLRSVVRSEIRRQLRGMGLVTREDIERLEERVQALEAKAEAGSGRSRKALPAADKSAAKRTTRSTAGQATSAPKSTRTRPKAAPAAGGES
jgi:BMFP domain-containing protein YqiC